MFGLFKRKKKAKKVEETPKPVVKEEAVVNETPTVEEEPIVQETPQEEVKEEEVETVEEPEEEKKPKRNQPYHITKHSKGGWQIKRGGAERALKRFDTQKEAIEYAKEIEKEKGVSYVIHKADGRTRKKNY